VLYGHFSYALRPAYLIFNGKVRKYRKVWKGVEKLAGKSEGKDRMRDMNLDVLIILKCILNKLE